MQVCEIFHSLQGECLSQGAPTTFVRFAGCNLCCEWCDTVYAQSPSEGTQMNSSAILDRIRQYEELPRRVCLTGGEPLLQPRSELTEFIQLLQSLRSVHISVETNGSQSIQWLQECRARLGWNLSLVVDYKLGFQRELMVWHSFTRLRSTDVIKFVCREEEDFTRVAELLRKLVSVHETHPVIYLHSVGGTPNRLAVERVLSIHAMFSTRFDVRYGIQLHKLLWGDERGK